MDNQPAQWRQATERLRNSILQLIDSYPDEVRLPSADSKAMAELADEERWKAPPDLDAWGPTPVSSAHELGLMQLRLAIDCPLGMAHLIGTDEVTAIYSPAALLRPVLEGAGRASWILDAGIGTRERVSRAMNERLESLYWQKNLPDKRLRDFATVRIRQILEAGRRLGFDPTPHIRTQRRFLAPKPPSHRELIRSVVDYTDDGALAKALTLLADSISHAGLFGPTAYLEVVDPTSHLDTQRARPRMTAKDANAMMGAALLALIRAGSERMELQGLPAVAWVEARERTVSTVREVLSDYQVS